MAQRKAYLSKKVPAKIKAYVKKEIKAEVETKQFPTEFTGANCINTGQLLSIFPPQIGDIQGTRTANQIHLTKLNFKIQAFQSGAAATPTKNRIIMFADTENQNTVLTLANAMAQLFYNVASAAPDFIYNVDTVAKPYGNGKRFKILHDKRWTSNLNGGATADGKSLSMITKYKGLGKKVSFNGNAGTNADIVDYAVYVLNLGNVGATPLMQYNAWCDYQYTDA